MMIRLRALLALIAVLAGVLVAPGAAQADDGGELPGCYHVYHGVGDGWGGHVLSGEPPNTPYSHGPTEVVGNSFSACEDINVRLYRQDLYQYRVRVTWCINGSCAHTTYQTTPRGTINAITVFPAWPDNVAFRFDVSRTCSTCPTGWSTVTATYEYWG